MSDSYFEIIIDGPFSFENTFRPHHRTTDTLKTMHVIPEENRFAKWIRLSDKSFLLDGTVRMMKERTKLEIHQTGKLTDAERQELVEYVTKMFGLGQSIDDFYDAFEKNEIIHALTLQFYGMRLIANPDLFETVVDTIIGQQVNLKFAATLKERLVRLAGEVRPFNDSNLYLFPTAGGLANFEYNDLRELSFSQRKAEYIIDFARKVASGEVDLDQLWDMSNEDVIDQLLPLRGIGRWTIECLQLFGLHRNDVLPAADIGLRNAVKMNYRLDHKPSDGEVRLLAEKEGWNPWESYITYYMWQSLKA